jgi:uncharacterized protein YecE (DUF72 family)
MRECGARGARFTDEAWSNTAFLKEEKLACGDDKKWVFGHERGDKRVKVHCRKVDAPRPRAKKAKSDPREKQLAALVRRRDKASNISEYNALDKQIKALRAELKPKSQPKPQPKQSAPPPQIASKPFGVDMGDTFGVLDSITGEAFTGNPGTGFDGVTKPVSIQPQPKFNQRIYTFVQSLPRGEQNKAMNALRQYVYGPGRMQPDDAIERYKDRRVRDAQAPIGSTEFDELDASDSDAEDDTAPPRRRGPMSQFFSSDTLPTGGGIGEITNGAGDGSRDDTAVPMYDAMFPPTENQDDSPVPGAAIAHRAMVVGQSRERALANARAEAERAAAEAQRARFITVDLPRILARSPESRDRILAVFANIIRDDEMANFMISGEGMSGGAHDAEEDLMAARAEHGELGDNALDGSQLAELLAGQGGAPTITAY